MSGVLLNGSSMYICLHDRRIDWRDLTAEVGLLFHAVESGEPYWDESRHFEFDESEIQALEEACIALESMFIDAGQHVLDKQLFSDFGIPPYATSAVKDTWSKEPPSLYGKFDLAFDGSGPPKLIEYNADVPTGLLEAAVIQWYWAKDVAPQSDQWNRLHEALVDRWKEVSVKFPKNPFPTHFVFNEHCSTEEAMTVAYLSDTAKEAGLVGRGLTLRQIRMWGQGFYDDVDEEINGVCKLYPWEWLLREGIGPAVVRTIYEGSVVWMEPPWKMLFSNKAILPVLWDLFPDSPYLLPAYNSNPRDLQDFVMKPKLGRDGRNICIVKDGRIEASSDGPYGGEGFIYQALGPTRQSDGTHAVMGCWMVSQAPSGMGIRVSRGPITGDQSQFVPHIIT